MSASVQPCWCNHVSAPPSRSSASTRSRIVSARGSCWATVLPSRFAAYAGCRAQPLEDARDPLGRRRVVGDHGLGGDARDEESEPDHRPGTVLAGGAVDDDGAVRLTDRPQRRHHRVGAPVEVAEVVLDQYSSCFRSSFADPGLRPVSPWLPSPIRTSSGLAVAPLSAADLRGRPHVAVGLPREPALAGRDPALLGVLGVERVVVELDARFGHQRSVALLGHLDVGPQVDDVGHAEVVDEVADRCRWQLLEVVGADQPARHDGAAVGRR